MGIFDKIFKGGCSCDVDETLKENTVKKEGIMTIKILGTGCKNCTNLTDNVEKAIASLNIEANIENTEIRKSTPASIAFIPSVMGIIAASEVIKDISHI